MSVIDNLIEELRRTGGSVFPSRTKLPLGALHEQQGINLRDAFALTILHSIISSGSKPDYAVNVCYKLADLVLQFREMEDKEE